MKIISLQSISLAFVFSLGMGLFPVQAQYVSITSTDPYSGTDDFEFQTGGTIFATGAFGGSGSLTGDEGAGTKMIWYAKKAAFRAGRVASQTGTSPNIYYLWDDAVIGSYSVAMGYDTLASQSYTTAFGNGSKATGVDASAFGLGSTASGTASTAFGDGTTASGNRSTALGGSTIAYGGYSIAAGLHTTSYGSYGTALGYYTAAEAYACLAIGRYNRGLGTRLTWVNTDSLFEIGNGTSATDEKNAFVVDKSGNVTAQGKMRCSPGGELSMGSFTATPSGVPIPANL